MDETLGRAGAAEWKRASMKPSRYQSRWSSIPGWALHLFTASGVVLGVLALQAIQQGNPMRAFLWMVVATIIDSVDGTMARKLQVSSRVPRIDGRRLDDIVDFFTYVIVPVYFLLALGFFGPYEWVFVLPLVSSALGFSNLQAKTEDNFFLGFPSYWNAVAIYIWLFQLSPFWTAWIVGFLAVLVLVPIRYLYPSKSNVLRLPTLVLCSIWGAQLLAQFLFPERMPNWWMLSTIYFPVYYIGVSWALDLRRFLAGGRKQKPSQPVEYLSEQA